VKVVCPMCWKEAVIKLDLDDGSTLTCGGCDGTFNVDDVRNIIEGWAKLMPWLLACPARINPTPATV
jgi:hypothetical protein